MDDRDSRNSCTTALVLAGALAGAGCFGEPAGSSASAGDDGSSGAASEATGPGATSDDPAGGPSTGSSAGTGDGSGDTSMSDSTGPGGAACGDEPGFTCLPPVPPDWTGPLASTSAAGGGDPGACPPGAEGDPPLVVDATVEPPMCGCDCAADTMPSCTVGPWTIQVSEIDTSCPVMDQNTTATGTCQNSVLEWFSVSTPAGGPMTTYDPGTCTPMGSAVVPPPEVGTRVRVCKAFGDPGGCAGDEVCTPPAPPGGQLCITHDGEVECPPGYDQRTVAYAAQLDDRGCTDCECAAPVGMCTAELELHSGGGCLDLVSTLGQAGCHMGAAIGSTRLVPILTTAGPCTSSTSMPTGGFELVEPTTICCV